MQEKLFAVELNPDIFGTHILHDKNMCEGGESGISKKWLKSIPILVSLL